MTANPIIETLQTLVNNVASLPPGDKAVLLTELVSFFGSFTAAAPITGVINIATKAVNGKYSEGNILKSLGDGALDVLAMVPAAGVAAGLAKAEIMVGKMTFLCAEALKTCSNVTVLKTIVETVDQLCQFIVKAHLPELLEKVGNQESANAIRHLGPSCEKISKLCTTNGEAALKAAKRVAEKLEEIIAGVEHKIEHGPLVPKALQPSHIGHDATALERVLHSPLRKAKGLPKIPTTATAATEMATAQEIAETTEAVEGVTHAANAAKMVRAVHTVHRSGEFSSIQKHVVEGHGHHGGEHADHDLANAPKKVRFRAGLPDRHAPSNRALVGGKPVHQTPPINYEAMVVKQGPAHHVPVTN